MELQTHLVRREGFYREGVLKKTRRCSPCGWGGAFPEAPLSWMGMDCDGASPKDPGHTDVRSPRLVKSCGRWRVGEACKVGVNVDRHSVCVFLTA